MLKEILEIQDYLKDAFEKSKHHGDLQDLYRRRYGCLVVRQSDSLKVCAPVYSSNLSKLRMPRLRGMCVNFSPGQTALMLVILCKSHDPFRHHFRAACCPPIVSHFPTVDALPFILCTSHLTLNYFVMHLLWNHCRSTYFYLNCMFIICHYPLASSLYPSIMHYQLHVNLYLCHVCHVK